MYNERSPMHHVMRRALFFTFGMVKNFYKKGAGFLAK